MNLPDLKKTRLLRRVAGALVVVVYGVVMAVTANHAMTQADPIPQRTWKPTVKDSTIRALARQPMDPASSTHHSSSRLTQKVSPPDSVNKAELRSAYLLYGLTMLGINPNDSTRHPWPHTGECVDDCSTDLTSEDPLQLSM